MIKMIKVSVLGATGYAGAELVRILCSHPEVELGYLGSSSFAGKPMSSVYNNFRKVIIYVNSYHRRRRLYRFTYLY